MMLGWVSLRRTYFQKPIIVVLIVSVLAISFNALIRSHPIRYRLAQWTSTSGRDRVRTSLGKHALAPNGLLIVNTEGPHPIFQLIRDAEEAWNAKHARASKTLEEAVAEYKRRYRRAPPLGFDKWWDYVVKHRVQLPDEYDEIFEDIEPFWGIDPRDLAHRQKQLGMRGGTVTVEKTDARPRFEVVSSTLPEERRHLLERVKNIIDLVSEVQHDLPPLRITFSPFDNPGMFSSWKVKAMALEAVSNGTTLRGSNMPPILKHSWIQGCPPGSPAHLHPPTYPPPAPLLPQSSPKTFIFSHRDAMDPCMHPSLFTTHGQFLTHKEGPKAEHTLMPRFSLCSTLLHHDIRPPVPYDWQFESDPDLDEDDEDGDEGDRDFEDELWESKTNDRLGWRGRTTGMYASRGSWWLNAHRARLVTFANALEGTVNVLRAPTNTSERLSETSPVGEPESVSLAQANEWLDVAFADEPIGCDQLRGTCDEMARIWDFRKMQLGDEEERYKFVLDVDGNGWSGRFKRLMTSNALIFKSTIYPEWYTSRIAPWVHYVPIQVSYADLYDAVSFFRTHDELAKRIAHAGRAWSQRYWRRQDMTAYLYRLLLEYARVMSLDRGTMDYVG